MHHYKQLNATHNLASYRVRLPVWAGANAIRQPFKEWAGTASYLPWYQAQHGSKHNRHEEFFNSSLENVINAVAGVVVLLAAQFNTYDFRPMSLGIDTGPDPDRFTQAIGGYFQLEFPDQWDPALYYDFNWQQLKKEPHPFRQLFAAKS